MQYISHTISKPFNHLNIKEQMDEGGLHRRVISPGDDVSNEVEDIKQSAAKFHTPEVIAAYEAHIANSDT